MKTIQRGTRRHPNRSATITTTRSGRKTVTRTNRQIGNQFQIETENDATKLTIDLANGTKVFLTGHDVRGLKALFSRHEDAKAGPAPQPAYDRDFGYFNY